MARVAQHEPCAVRGTVSPPPAPSAGVHTRHSIGTVRSLRWRWRVVTVANTQLQRGISVHLEPLRRDSGAVDGRPGERDHQVGHEPARGPVPDQLSQQPLQRAESGPGPGRTDRQPAGQRDPGRPAGAGRRFWHEVIYRGATCAPGRVRSVFHMCWQPGQKQLCVSNRSSATRAVRDPHRGQSM